MKSSAELTRMARSLTATTNTTFPALSTRERLPMRLDRVPASSMTSLRASVSADLSSKCYDRSASGGSVGDEIQVVEEHRTPSTPFGLPRRVVAVLRQMSPHADRLTWTVAEGSDAVSLALAWDFTTGGTVAVNENGRRERGRRSASCGDSRRGRNRVDKDSTDDREAFSDDDGKSSRRHVVSDRPDEAVNGDHRRLNRQDGGTRLSFRFWHRLRTLATQSRPVTDGHRETTATDRKSNNDTPSSAISRLRHRWTSTSGSGNDVTGDEYDLGSIMTTNTNCHVKSDMRVTTSSGHPERTERSSGRNQRMFSRCTNRLLDLPLLRRLRLSRRPRTVTSSAVTSTSGQPNGNGDADNNSLALQGRVLLTSTSLPERINRQASISAIVGTRKPPDRDSADGAMYWYQLSHELQQHFQLDTPNLVDSEPNGRHLRHHQLRHRHSSRDLLTSPEAESITSSAPFPNSSSAAVDHQSFVGRRLNHHHQQHQLLQPLQRMAVGKRSSWPRALHPPSSVDLCSGGDVVDSPMELQLPPFQSATSACRIRRLSRPRQPAVTVEQASALMTAPTVSDCRPFSDAHCHSAATEAIMISPERIGWRRSTYRGHRTSTATAFSYGRATETASMCSIDAITYVTGPNAQSSAANACRYDGGGDQCGFLVPVSRSLDDIETPLSAAVIIGGTSGGGTPQTSGVDCETVIRCLDSCDKILLRHSTTIT